jgi:hypothetical protein
LLVTMTILAATLPPVVAAQEIGDGWLPGPGANGANTYAGAIDAPRRATQLTTAGAVQVAGWFVDRTAQGWAGADDVEVYLGTLGNGGTLLTHAFFAQDRPDVAAALGHPDWQRSGWTAVFPSAALVPGNNLLTVYAHSPEKGWWYRQVTLSVAAAATPRRAPTEVGFDISFPQCGGAEPSAPAFAIVGVNGGRAFSANPCLAREYIWATTATSPVQPHVGFYMNTGNPGPEASLRWPRPGTATPRPCDGSWSPACAFDYGWLAAEDAYARARSVAGGAAAVGTWWLDVESANSWSENTGSNSAALQGALAYLRSVGVGTLGIYALAADWETVIGASSAAASENAPFGGLPNWRPGARADVDAQSWCTRSVTGGRVMFVQYPSGGFDGNSPCN